MAPAVLSEMIELGKRQFGNYCPSGYYRSGRSCYRRRNSNWNSWGRWVALVLIVLFFTFLFFLLSCVNARRRRKRGLSPRYGTGWLGGTPGQYQNNNYAGGYNNNNNAGYTNNNDIASQPAPPYSPPPQNNYNQNDGYYGQQSGIELQQPQNAYHPGTGGSPAYNPPPGPPPGKGGDGIIR